MHNVIMMVETAVDLISTENIVMTAYVILMKHAFFDTIGNGHCDDSTNTETCNFDGGDCCGPCSNKHSCSSCLCLEEAEIDPYCK